VRSFRIPIPRRYPLAVAAIVGIPIGLALFTFSYAEGLSYFSSDPRACANCHIMQDQYDSWSKSGHHHVAACNDCHLPRTLVPKLAAKARNGWNHSSAFTLENFPEPIRIGSRNAEILQENCLHCHGSFVHDVVRAQSPREIPGESVSCVHCHKGVGHAPTRPTSPMSWIGHDK
jgi:cytochrome c nitrite reductase small subunit